MIGAFRRLSISNVVYVEESRKELFMDVQMIAQLEFYLIDLKDVGVIIQNSLESSLVIEVK